MESNSNWNNQYNQYNNHTMGFNNSRNISSGNNKFIYGSHQFLIGYGGSKLAPKTNESNASSLTKTKLSALGHALKNIANNSRFSSSSFK